MFGHFTTLRMKGLSKPLLHVLIYVSIYLHVTNRPYLLPWRLRFSQPLVFCPEYIIFVEMNILKTFEQLEAAAERCSWK